MFIANGCYVEGPGEVVIEDGVQMGPNISFLTSTHDVLADGAVSRTPEGLPVRVGRGAWIGGNVTVVGGASIGAGAIVAAGAVVVGELRGGWVHAGVPARPIRALTAEEDPERP